MRFEFDKGLIWIPITIVYEGKAVTIDHCIVDTGSATTALDIDLVAFNYRKPAFIKRLCGLGGGTQEVICQNIDSVVLDNIEMECVDIEFGDISSHLGINGFIGNDILSRFSLTFDFLQRTINLIRQR